MSETPAPRKKRRLPPRQGVLPSGKDLGDIDGKPLLADTLGKMSIRFFDNNQVEFILPGEKQQRVLGTFEIDPIKKQICIRFTDSKVVETMSYRWENDQLVLESKAMFLGGPPKQGPLCRMRMERVKDKLPAKVDEEPLPPPCLKQE